jgi:formylglycine-generating enzyme required for sulfatase activity
MGKYEVTRAQWKQILPMTILGNAPPFQDTTKLADYPAAAMDWVSAMEFCRLLTEQERAAGRLPDDWKYALPTEAQWEYACRAGTTTRYSFGDDAASLDDCAWYQMNTLRVDEAYVHEIGRKQPNAWGLHDMYGNVSEWCRDVYVSAYPGGADPMAPASSGSQRVLRGGGWNSAAANCRSAARRINRKDDRYGNPRDEWFLNSGVRIAAVLSGS